MIPVAMLKLSQKDAQRLEFQSNGSLFLTISSGVLRVWDWRNEVAMLWSEQFPAVTNAAMSPDGLTGLEANLRFASTETMETRIFGRLSAWQNWIFQRPNAVGADGALKRYGTGKKPDLDPERV